MNDPALEERLRAFYRVEVPADLAAPSDLRSRTVAIPQAPLARWRRSDPRRGVTLLAAAALLGTTIGAGALIAGSGGPPAPAVAVASPTPQPTTDTPAVWIATGSMTEVRSGHTATLLPDGRVLVAGGETSYDMDQDRTTPSSSEVYDPDRGLWSATGDMTVARPGTHTATLLQDGRVLVVGGDAARKIAELYDPSRETWTATGPMVEGHGRGHTATLLDDGRVLVAGGFGGDGYLAAAQLYDPASGTWSAAESMSAGRVYHTATLLRDGRVLVAGSVRMNGVPIPEDRLGDTAELFDPDTGTWRATGSLIDTRHDFKAILLTDGTVLAGPDDNSLFTELYDPISGTWSATGSVAVRRVGGYTATLLPDGTVLVVGGDGAEGLTELYDPRTGTWTEAPRPRSPHGGTATLLRDGTVLVAGGGSASAELFVPGRTD